MIKMRNGWEEGGMPSLRGDSSPNKLPDENGTRRYDFGVSRPISAPPPSGMGFETSKLLHGLDRWRSDDTEEEAGETRYNGMKFDVDEKDNILNSSSFFNGDSITRCKSAAPQFNHGIFQTRKDDLDKETNTLFEEFDIMKIGSRRSASTGVLHALGTHSSAMDSLGLSLHEGSNVRKQTSFMDLIQEDGPAKTPQFDNDHASDHSNHAKANHSIPQKSENFYQMHGELNLNVGRPVRQSGIMQQHQQQQQQHQQQQQQQQQQNQMNQVPIQAMPTYQYQTHHSQAPRSPDQRHPNTHLQPNMQPNQQQQTMYAHAPGVQYYDSHQRGNGPTHQTQTHPHMHPQVVQNNPNGPSAMYVNPAYGGGYASMQYHPSSPPQYTQAQVLHTHDPNMNSRIPHPQQFITAIPIHGMTGPSNGTYIYFHQPGPGHVMAQAPPNHHAQSIAVLDSNGRPATIVSQGGMQGSGRSPPRAPSGMVPKGEKVGRKPMRNTGRKAPSSMDGSRHSLSSGTLNLLEEYRSSKDRSWTAADVRGHIVEFCQDQNGSRFIQQRLELANDDEKNLILAEILPAVKSLRNDVFGNYVVQKLFEHSNDDMKTKLKLTLVGEMVELSSQMYGCRVVQKALERMNDEDLIKLLSEFHVPVLACIHDQNGNHVIQKIVEVVSSRSKTYQAEDKGKAVKFSMELRFILDCVLDNIVPLSCHPFGCRVLQRILEHCVESQKSMALDCIQKSLRVLLDDQYGNYVIQHVLQFGRKSDRDVVLNIVAENGILGLSRQKFASNVIEKLLKYGNGDHRNAIVREMLKIVDDKTVETGRCSIVLLMVRDAYANYVVQTTLDVVPEGKDKELLLQELRNNSSKLRNYTFAKHIITKLEEGDVNVNPRVG